MSDLSGLLVQATRTDERAKNRFLGLQSQGIEAFKQSSLGKVIEEALAGPQIRRPTLGSVAPPRTRTSRNQDPFDFFGTLFTTPATSGLQNLSLMNQTL